jgi:hypothetical protein
MWSEGSTEQSVGSLLTIGDYCQALISQNSPQALFKENGNFAPNWIAKICDIEVVGVRGIHESIKVAMPILHFGYRVVHKVHSES